VLAEAIGWPAFFLVAIAMGVPSLIWLQGAVAADRGARRALSAAEPLEARTDRNHLPRP
jgi:predicted MFS family arabinose efflux permease